MNPNAKLDTEREAQRQVTLHRWYDSAVRTAVSICKSFPNCSNPPMSNPSPKIGLHELVLWTKKEQKKTRKGKPKYIALQQLYDNCELCIKRDDAEPTVYKVNRSEFLRSLSGRPITEPSATLESKEYSILCTLDDSFPEAMLLTDIAQVVKKDRRTVKEKLEQLQTKGFANPQGKRKGWGITKKGVDFLRQIYPERTKK
jgi:predicted transcriptional regulator